MALPQPQSSTTSTTEAMAKLIPQAAEGEIEKLQAIVAKLKEELGS